MFKERKVLVRSIHCHMHFFVGDKTTDDCFKDDFIPSLKANYSLKFAQDVTFNYVR